MEYSLGERGGVRNGKGRKEKFSSLHKIDATQSLRGGERRVNKGLWSIEKKKNLER